VQTSVPKACQFRADPFSHCVLGRYKGGLGVSKAELTLPSKQKTLHQVLLAFPNLLVPDGAAYSHFIIPDLKHHNITDL